jgi:sigma-B regulation protein RsbU (phosphoserine phosphatase)
MEYPFERLSLPARVESVRLFHQFVRTGAEAVGLDSADMNKLDLVLEEILVNIARYAYEDGAGDVEVAYSADASSLLVEVTDGGRSFNPLDAAPPDLALGLADRPIGGLGVLLVRQIVGSLSYRRQDGQNTLSFRFPGPKTAST